MTDAKFPDGLSVFDKHERAPNFVIGKISISPDRFIPWLEVQQRNDKGYVTLQLKRANSGKLYAELDTYGLTKRDDQQRTETRKAEPKSEHVHTDSEGDDVPF